MKKIILLILDGFGIRNELENNAIALAKTPNISLYQKKYCYSELNASESFVGLPHGVFGNSEVGHLNLGAGRIVAQVINTIDDDIVSGAFAQKKEFINVLDNDKTQVVHIMGLLSDGAVHAMNTHFQALIKMASQHEKINKVWLHVFLDGRDTPPNSGLGYLKSLEAFIKSLADEQRNKIAIATISGRYYAMDRDNRYERIERAYNAIVNAVSDPDAIDIINSMESVDNMITMDNYLQSCYKKNIFDEFIYPYVGVGYSGMNEGDVVFFTNFRADRAIQLTKALSMPDFTDFTRKYKQLQIVTMTSYSPKLPVIVAYEKQKIENTLGEIVAKHQGRQLRAAETEKYPHVTYFFSGGIDALYEGEDRLFVASSRSVSSYDQQPEMSLPELATKLIEAFTATEYNLVVANFANGDMVGHTGRLDATIKAVEALDYYVGKVVDAALLAGYEIIITADHGNCEQMYDEKHNVPHTQHTVNPVPFIYIGRPAEVVDLQGNDCRSLKDIAPTILYLLGIEKPEQMTGESLIQLCSTIVDSVSL